MPTTITSTSETHRETSGPTRCVDQVTDLGGRPGQAARTSGAGGGCGSLTERVRAALVDGRGPQAAPDHSDREEPGSDAPRDRGPDVRPGRCDQPATDGRVVCVDEFGPLNLLPRKGKAWRPARKPRRLRD